ncbi:MAG: hypothetical protein DMH00_12855 [Acidobacteria bacterium]|nr:MAG: hypothetical protein DMH00_12855 [Acidobacteriota bacterium]
MLCVRRPEEKSIRRLAAAFVCVLVLVAAARPARGEDRILVQGLADAEIWNTDAESELLSRDAGDTASLGRLRLWAAGDFMNRLQGFALGRVEGGRGTDEGRTDVHLEQAYLRYSFAAPKRLVLQAGKLILPYGNFSRRYFSNANPLIGSPANYQISYPLGIQLSGAASRFDFMAAIVDGPLTRQAYDSDPERSLRPALSAGITPVTGIRIAGYFTRGAYLDRIAELWLLPGKELGDYHEKSVGADLQVSRGHFELNGELTQTRLEVPAAGHVSGRIWYVEPKYTFSPRWYAALRWERGWLPDANWIWATLWSAEQSRVQDLEAGAGFRIGPRFLVKTTYRTEIGNPEGGAQPQGHALALQFSFGFDVNSWFERPR